ncbi:MAG: T9SS type A sorting domain-containing protein [Ignavibacteriales bacterium]|nr:T9SS type A sorting domain-containing protein [Ignavibacteriales bacterium]
MFLLIFAMFGFNPILLISQPLNVRITDYGETGPLWDPSLVINPTDTNNFIISMVGKLSDVNRVHYYYSTDATQSWGMNRLEINNPGWNSEEPRIAFSKSGNGWIVYSSYLNSDKFNNNGIYAARTSAKGSYWPVTKTVVENKVENGSIFEDDPDITVTGGLSPQVYVIWTKRFSDTTKSKIFIARTSDASTTGNFQDITQVSFDNSVNSFAPSIGSAGDTLFMVWLNSKREIIFDLSLNGTSTLSNEIQIASNVNIIDTAYIFYNKKIEVKSSPSIAVDASMKTIYVVWSENGTTIYFKKVSYNNGAIAVSPLYPTHKIKVSNEIGLNWNPRITLSPDRKNIYVSYYHINSGDSTVSVRVASSCTDGMTFTHSNITDTTFSLGTFKSLGRSMGIAALTDRVYPIWCDTRDGYKLLYMANEEKIIFGVKQLMSNNFNFSSIRKWNGEYFSGLWNGYLANYNDKLGNPDSIILSLNSNQVFLADTSYMGWPGSEKFYNWGEIDNYVVQQSLIVTQAQKSISSRFQQVDSSIVITTGIIDFPGVEGGYIEFSDPWLIDSLNQLGRINRGSNAVFRTVQCPFSPVTSPTYKGMFLNQDPELSPVFYSLRVPRTQVIGNFTSTFEKFTVEGAELVQDTRVPFSSDTNYYQWVVIFREPTAFIRLLYKATRASLTKKMNSGWNLISLPVQSQTVLKDNLLPSSSSEAFTYDQNLGRYVVKDTLKKGIGYWVSYSDSESVMLTGTTIYSDSVPVKAGWNMVGSISIPFDRIYSIPTDNIVSSFLSYEGGDYIPNSTILPGNGYWIKVEQDGSVIYNRNTYDPELPPLFIAQPPPPPGAPLTPVLLSPVNGATGVANPPTLCWNESETATSYNLQVATSSAFTTVVYQANGLTSTCSFAGGLSYSTTYYWRVKAVNEFGESNWSSIRWFTTKSAPLPDPDPDPCITSSSITALDEFTIVNGNGNKQTLYAKNGKNKLDVGFTNFDMPPEPVGGIFHAKFKTDKFIENIPPGKGLLKIPIKVKNAQYPITVEWKIKENNGVSYWISRTGNDKDKQPISGNGSIGLGSTKDGDIIIIAQAIDPCGDLESKSGFRGNTEEQVSRLPEEFKLEQNTPNPFNPTTIINYQLPIDNWVTIKAYNILGEEIATLVDEMKDAGYKSVTFDGSNLPSGIYFVRMNAGSFNDVKKIVLAK